MCLFFFFKQKTAYEIKECDWSSDVCSSDLDKLVLKEKCPDASEPVPSKVFLIYIFAHATGFPLFVITEPIIIDWPNKPVERII